MSDDPLDPKFFLPLDDNAPGNEPARPLDEPVQPKDSYLPEGSQAGSQTGPLGDDYVSELRQNLNDHEPESSKASRRTGGLFQRITGSLRRSSNSTGKLDPSFPDPVQPLETQPEIPDDFLAGRLGDGVFAPDEPAPAALSLWDEEDPRLVEVPGFSQTQEQPLDTFQIEGFTDEPILNGDEPISLLDSGAIAALGSAEEASKNEEEPDWMAAIRQETPRDASVTPPVETPAAPASETPAPRGVTGQLRNFIAGILGGSEEKHKPPTGKLSMPDEVVTNRLGRSLGTVPDEAVSSAQAAEAAPELDQYSPLPGEPAAEDLLFERFNTGQESIAAEEDNPFLESLEARFGQMGDWNAEEDPSLFGAPVFGAPAETLSLDTGQLPDTDALPYLPDDFSLTGAQTPVGEPGRSISPDETFPEGLEFLWETQPDQPVQPDLGPVISAEDIWDRPAVPDEPVRLDPIVTPVDPPPAPVYMRPEDVFAAQFLTGQLIEPAPAPTSPPPELLHKALARSSQTASFMPVGDIRSIALEGYEEIGPAEHPTGDAAAENGAYDNSAAQQAWNLKDWYADRSPVQKILLFEVAAVALALLVAIPFFIYMILRGPVQPQMIGGPTPNPLPANLPYPTGLTLPGGWYFALGKSTFAGGAWKPSSSEWLEGTELRRVVALPWNAQTEAVFQTFKPGDRVSLSLNNSDLLVYKIYEVRRVPASDASIMSDISPSLLVVLYQEDAKERWVILAKP